MSVVRYIGNAQAISTWSTPASLAQRHSDEKYMGTRSEKYEGYTNMAHIIQLFKLNLNVVSTCYILYVVAFQCHTIWLYSSYKDASLCVTCPVQYIWRHLIVNIFRPSDTFIYFCVDVSFEKSIWYMYKSIMDGHLISRLCLFKCFCLFSWLTYYLHIK